MKIAILICALLMLALPAIANTEYEVSTVNFNLPDGWSFGDLDGNFVAQWTDIGYPYVLVLSNDSVWFTDARHERVRQLNLNGKLVSTFQGKKGRNVGQFDFAHGLHVTEQKQLFVTQVLNWSVLLLTPLL